MKADSLLSIEIKPPLPPPPEEFEYKTPIEMDHNNRSKTILKLHTGCIKVKWLKLNASEGY